MVSTAKKVLIAAMAVVFCLFVSGLMAGIGEVIGGVNFSIIVAVILIGLFVTFIMVSEHDRKSRNRRS